MADAVVSIVLERLTGSFIHELKFLGGVGDQVELAQTELQFMQGYLKDADARQGGNEALRIWVTRITDAAYDLEDVIESFVLKVASKGKRSVLKRFTGIFIKGIHLHKIGSKIEKITTKLSKSRSMLPSYNLQEIRGSGADTSFQRQQERRLAYPHVIEPHVVGLAGATEILTTHLIKENHHRVISIWGMGGLGKTTLAKQVYNHDEVKRHFDCFAWVCISQQCQGREVLAEILAKLISANNEQRKEIANLKKDEIAERLCIIQRERKCLVMLDDIWTCDALNSLEAGFPMNEETGSRILLTTRSKEVALCADIHGLLYQPQSLNDDESWELFQKIAISGAEDTSSKIYAKKEELGTKMLQHCAGLPLAITVLAGVLARKDTIDEWDKVHKNFYAYVGRGTDLGPEYKGEEYKGVSWILALSYDNLPYRLKLCFLYLANFPEDYEIPVNELTKLWMAEGFISSPSTEMMEDVAYSCLSELVDRCMVVVGKLGSIRKTIKTCRLHDLMRDLCVLKAKEVNFLHIINCSVAQVTKEAPIGRIRRLAIYMGENEYALGRDEGDGQLRSLLHFGPELIYSGWKWNKELPLLLKDFKFLRVLKLENLLELDRLPSKIGNLVHLRFLSLKNTAIRALPSSVANLVCLQTLDFRVETLRRIKIPNVFRKMEQLRHLYLPYCLYPYRVSVSGKLSFATRGNLQTLVNVESNACDLDDLVKLTNLRKLVVKEKDYSTGEIKKETRITFNHLQSLSVESRHNSAFKWDRVLSCPHIYKLRVKGIITEIPEDLIRLSNLTKLTLCGIHHDLKDHHMQILEKLPSLTMLFLTRGSWITPFEGPLVCSRGGFPHLEVLSLSGLDELKEWRVEKGAMPSLRKLHIQDCDKLQVPDGLKYITTLQELTILYMPWAELSITTLRKELEAELINENETQQSRVLE